MDRAGLRAMPSMLDPSATTTSTVLTALFLSGSRECRKTVMPIRCPRPRPESRDRDRRSHPQCRTAMQHWRVRRPGNKLRPQPDGRVDLRALWPGIPDLQSPAHAATLLRGLSAFVGAILTEIKDVGVGSARSWRLVRRARSGQCAVGVTSPPTRPLAPSAGGSQASGLHPAARPTIELKRGIRGLDAFVF